MKDLKTKHDCKKELRDVFLKSTPARIGILEALEKTNKPLDVASLIIYLKEKSIKVDNVTVFRIVNILLEKGLITPIQLGEGKFRYEHISKSDHHHFICEKCNKIEDISNCNIDILEKNIQKKKGIIIKRHSLEFFGICQNCQN